MFPAPPSGSAPGKREFPASAQEAKAEANAAQCAADKGSRHRIREALNGVADRA